MLFKKKKSKKPKPKGEGDGEGDGQTTLPTPPVPPTVETSGDLKTKEVQLAEWEAKLEAKSKELRAWQEDLEARQKSAGSEGEGNGEETERFVLPENAPVAEWEKMIAEIKSFLAEATAKLEEAKELEETYGVIQKRIDDYHNKGFNVSRLRSAAKELSPEEVKEMLTKFEEDLGVLKIFEEKVEALKPYADEAHVAELRKMLKDPELINDIQAKIEEIEGRMQTRRGEIKAKIAAWARDGFDVSRLEEALDHDVKALFTEFNAFEARLDRAKIIIQKLDSLDPLFQNEIDALRSKVKLMENLDEVEKRVGVLEEREEEKKKEFLEKLKGWHDEGYDVTRLENISSGNLSVIQQEFEKYRKDVEHLVGLGVRLKRLKNPKAVKLEPYLKKPDEVVRLEKAIEKLESMEGEEHIEPEPPKPVPVEPKPTPLPPKPVPVEPKPAPVEPKPTPPTPPPTEVAPPPAGATPEEEANYIINITDGLIEKAKAAGKDVNTPNNLLRLAKSFMRSKNYEKAKQYAERVQKMVQDQLAK